MQQSHSGDSQLKWIKIGNYYTGSWKKCFRLGYGEFNDRNVTYSGEYRSDMMHGQSKLTRNANKTVLYEGEWTDNQPVMPVHLRSTYDAFHTFGRDALISCQETGPSNMDEMHNMNSSI